jgi:excisionase family DNA binding protein
MKIKAIENTHAAAAMLTVDQAWQRIGTNTITKQALYLAIARGEVPSVRLGRRILLPRVAFEEFLQGSTKSTPSAA